MKRMKLLIGLLLFISSLCAQTTYEVSTLEALESRANLARAGDVITLAPGDYQGEIVLDKKYNEEVTFIFGRINLQGGNNRFAIDLKGENITVFLLFSTIKGGREANIAQRGDNITIIGDKTILSDANQGLILLGKNHVVSGLTFDGHTTTGISGNNLKLDPVTRNTTQGFNWGGKNNWRISGCSFYNIRPPSPGNAGGAIRLIPHVFSVIVDNCHFEDIAGNALWFDHYMSEIELYYNTFVNIEYKCIFLEIGDRNPNNPGLFGAKVAGNIGRNNQRHGVFVAASSDVEIYGNDFDGWPIVLGGMQRDFYRRIDHKDQSTWIRVDAELKDIKVTENVLYATEGRNHLMAFTGERSKNNVIRKNYYVIGNTSNYKSTFINDARFSLNDGKFLHNTDKVGVQGVDNQGIVGPAPSDFPFPDALERIPIPKKSGPIIDIPDPDTTVTDTPGTNPDRPRPPPVITDLPRVWVTSDMSEAGGRTDNDDKLWLAFMAYFQDRADFIGITVGAHKYDLPKALDWANSEIGLAYAQERDNLVEFVKDKYEINQDSDGGFPQSLPFIEASTMGKGFKEGLETLEDYPSVKGIVDAASEGKLYILNGGPLGEVATAVEYALRKNPSAVANMIIISHATTPGINNCTKDQKACDYLHDLAAEGKIKFFECGFSGKIIDNKTFPKMGGGILQSKIGNIFKYKWQAEKPDFSDGITFVILAFPELGGGPAFLAKLDHDGTSNLQKINELAEKIEDWKGKLYDLINERGDAAKGDYAPEPGTGGGNPNPDPLPTNTKDRVEKAIGILEEVLKELRSIKQSLN